MSAKEAQRVGIMQQIDKGILTLRKASVELGLSLSQTKKIRKRYRVEGVEGCSGLVKVDIFFRDLFFHILLDSCILKKLLLLNGEQYTTCPSKNSEGLSNL